MSYAWAASIKVYEVDNWSFNEVWRLSYSYLGLKRRMRSGLCVFPRHDKSRICCEGIGSFSDINLISARELVYWKRSSESVLAACPHWSSRSKTCLFKVKLLRSSKLLGYKFTPTVVWEYLIIIGPAGEPDTPMDHHGIDWGHFGTPSMEVWLMDCASAIFLPLYCSHVRFHGYDCMRNKTYGKEKSHSRCRKPRRDKNSNHSRIIDTLIFRSRARGDVKYVAMTLQGNVQSELSVYVEYFQQSIWSNS